jgi:hypothetical protein
MANHGYVTTRCHITVPRMQTVLENLNERVFRYRLRIEYVHSLDEAAWGEHCWELTIPRPYEPDFPYARRFCWLTSKRKFEIRHGGTNFAFWLGSVVSNEVAVAFDGTITDDGGSGRWKGVPNKYDRYNDYLDMIWKNNQYKEYLRQVYRDEAPEEFW